MPERCAASPLGGAGESDTTTESWNICIFIFIGEKKQQLTKSFHVNPYIALRQIQPISK